MRRKVLQVPRFFEQMADDCQSDISCGQLFLKFMYNMYNLLIIYITSQRLCYQDSRTISILLMCAVYLEKSVFQIFALTMVYIFKLCNMSQ